MCWIRSRTVYAAILSLLLLAGVALRVASFTWNTRLQGDVNLSALTAREFVQHDRLYYPMKYEFSDHVAYKALASPADQHPPLWPLAAGLLGKVLRTDSTFLLLKLLCEAVGIGLMVVVVYAGTCRRRPIETIVALAFVALAPELVDYSANGSMYILLAALLVLAALLLERFRPDHLFDYALAGVLCGVGIQTHSVMLLMPAAFLFFWWRASRGIPWKGIAVAVAAGLMTVIPWMLWNYHYFRTPFYSSSTYHFLGQFGLAKIAALGDVVTLVGVRSPDAVFLTDYLPRGGSDSEVFHQHVLCGCRSVLPRLAGCWFGKAVPTAPARGIRFASAGFDLYTYGAFVGHGPQPFRGTHYPVDVSGGCRRRRVLAERPSPVASSRVDLPDRHDCWSLVGYRDQPPTRYYQYDAEWAATYAKMLPLAQELGKRERGVVLSYAYILDGGIETVYWDRQPFVYGRELPPEALSKVVEDFGVRYLWTQADMSEDLLTRFPRAQEILVNDVFHVLELPVFDLVPLTSEQQVAAVRAAGQPDPTVLAPMASTAVRPVEDQVWFGDQIRLAGAAVEPWEGDLLVDLVWATTAPKLAAVQYFIHVTDAQGNLVAQCDGPLGRWPDETESEWTAGSLLRQRIRLRVPSTRPGPRRGHIRSTSDCILHRRSSGCHSR